MATRIWSDVARETTLTTLLGNNGSETEIAVAELRGWPSPAVGEEAVGYVDYDDLNKLERFTYTGKSAATGPGTLTGATRGADASPNGKPQHDVGAAVAHRLGAADILKMWRSTPESIALAETFALLGDLTPATITADQNDYSPTGLEDTSILRLATNASRNLTGLAGGSEGRLVVISNVGANDLVLKDENGASAVANRFALAGDIVISPDESLLLWYDATSSRWRANGVVSVNAVSFAEIQDISAASRLLGRGDSGSGDPEEILIGSGLQITGNTLGLSGAGGESTGSILHLWEVAI